MDKISTQLQLAMAEILARRPTQRGGFDLPAIDRAGEQLPGTPSERVMADGLPGTRRGSDSTLFVECLRRRFCRHCRACLLAVLVVLVVQALLRC